MSADGGVTAMICNLSQNPKRKAVVSEFLPTLLQSGIMWLLRPLDAKDDGAEERWMLSKDTIYQH